MIEELYDALIEAGATEKKARAASRAVADMERHFANIEKDILSLRSHVDQSLTNLRSHVDQSLTSLRSHVDQSLTSLRSYVDQRFTAVDQRFTTVEATLRLHNWMLGTILAFLVAVFFKVFSK